MTLIHSLRSRSIAGFTLLELLVVVAIIGFLSSVSIVALSASKSKSRDTQRKLDQVTIIKATELYINDFGAPPSQLCQYDESGACQKTSMMNVVPSSSSEQFDLPAFFEISTAHADIIQNCNPGEVICRGVCVPFGSCPGGGSPGCIVNGICEVSLGENEYTCEQDCLCDGDAICEGSRSENMENCPSDCSMEPGGDGGGGGTPETCGNGQCDPGEYPANCSQDCTESSICFINGEWNLCCLFGGSYCSGSGGSTSLSGYYGVCNVDRCEQKYLLQKPAATCDTDSDCLPTEGVGGTLAAIDKFVADENSNWLEGLQPYVVTVPKDPGGHDEVKYDTYFASSHPEIVKGHRFCVWVSFERIGDNFNPYNDIVNTPTGGDTPETASELLRWTPLCVR